MKRARRSSKVVDKYALCEEREIEVLTPECAMKVKAWCRGDLATNRPFNAAGEELDYWVITHLPSGSSLAPAGCVFLTQDEAVRALVDIARLKNSWENFEATAELGLSIWAIAKRYRGNFPIRPGPPVPKDTQPLNGY